MINVREYNVEITADEMENTGKLLVALSCAFESILTDAAKNTGENMDDVHEAAEGGERALIVGAAACRMVAAAMRKKEAERSCPN